MPMEVKSERSLLSEKKIQLNPIPQHLQKPIPEENESLNLVGFDSLVSEQDPILHSQIDQSFGSEWSVGSADSVWSFKPFDQSIGKVSATILKDRVWQS